jgi:two-component sensor histidine kinase
MKKYFAICCCLIFVLSSINTSYSQEKKYNDDYIYKVEKLIVQQKFDAINLDSILSINDKYSSVLHRIIKKNNVTYSDYHFFLLKLFDRVEDIKFESTSFFFNTYVEEPSKEIGLDIDFVKMKSAQIHGLREWVNIEEANKEQIKLDNYVKYFKQKGTDVSQAKLYVDLHQAVLLGIQKDIDNGLKLCKTNIQIAKQIGDREMEMAFSYHLLEFVMAIGDLEGYIEICEKSLEIEQSLKSPTDYYLVFLYKALEAYIYKGNSEERILDLFDSIRNLNINDNNLLSVLNIKYVEYLGDKSLSNNTVRSIFDKFRVTGLKEFCEKISIDGEKHLSSNDLKYLYNSTSKVLLSHNYFKEAFKYKNKEIELIKKIYTQELSNSLADEKSRNTVELKNIEINHEKEKSNLLLLIVSLVIVVLLVFVIAFIRKRKYSKDLKEKNDSINKALSQKKILIREIHHRVKNNYQVMMSLLDMQSEGINDNKVLDVFKEGQNRMRSMAIIHEDLSQNANELIDFELYIKLLIQEITVIYAETNKNIDVVIEAKDFYFDIDTAVPLGLIINELTTNTYKYAFKNVDKGVFKIEIKEMQKGEYNLIVSDNGSGFDSSSELKKTKSIGLILVKRLVKQLYGTLSIISDNGTSFNINFKDTTARNLID